MPKLIVLDVGGTNIRAAIYPEKGFSPIVQERIPTYGQGSPEERICGLVKNLWDDSLDIQAIAVAAPGPLDHSAGIIHSASNIPEWIEFPLAQYLESRFHVPVYLGNDANMAALGEWKLGSGKGFNDLLYLTISTGIGGGVISAGNLLLGARGMAAELGHVTLDLNGPLCTCGQRGHLEAYSAGPAISFYVNDQVDAGRPSIMNTSSLPSAEEVAKAAKLGDDLAIEAIARSGKYLGLALADFLHIFNPSLIVLGGGVSQSGDLLFKPLKESLEKHVMTPRYVDNLLIRPASLGDNAGLIGALIYLRGLLKI